MALEDVVDRHEAPGAAVAAVSGGAIIASAAAGVADLARGTAMSPQGACNWFSMTKIATATAAMMLVDRGRLDLGAPVSAYLGEVWPSGFAAVRVRHLLDHSSGLRNPIPIRWVHRAGQPTPDDQQFLAQVLSKQRAPKFEPGTRAAYSNVGYLALGAVIGEASGSGYEAFVRGELLAPLGMSHTGYHWTDPAVAAVPRVTGYVRAFSSHGVRGAEIPSARHRGRAIRQAGRAHAVRGRRRVLWRADRLRDGRGAARFAALQRRGVRRATAVDRGLRTSDG